MLPVFTSYGVFVCVFMSIRGGCNELFLTQSDYFLHVSFK